MKKPFKKISTENWTTSKEMVILFFIIVLSVLGQFASDSYLPSFMNIAHYFHVGNGLVQSSVSVYLIGMGLAQIFFGFFSDTYGRKPIILCGLGLFIIATTICTFAATIHLFLFGRFLQGLGLAGPAAVIRALMKDTYHGKKLAQVSSYLMMAITITPPLAPIVGGYLQHFFDWRANFIVVFILASLISILLWKIFPETLSTQHKHPLRFERFWRASKEVLTTPIFLVNVTASALAYACIILYMTITPFLYQHIIGLTPIQFGWLSIFNGASLSIGSYLNSRLLNNNISPKHMVYLGNGSLFLGGLIMLILFLFFHVQLLAILIPMFFVFVGVSWISANTVIEALIPFGHTAGLAGSIYGTMQILLTGLISFLVVALKAENQLPLTMSLLGIGFLIFLVSSSKRTLVPV